MRLTQILCKQHIGRMVKKHWYDYGIKRPYDTRCEHFLTKMGIKVEDPKILFEPKKELIQFDFEKIKSRKPLYDKTEIEPGQDRICYSYTDDSLFIEGSPQAKLLFKTVCIEDKLPGNFIQLEAVPKTIDDQVQRIVRTSTIFDAHQEKLPKRKHPEKLMWNYARDFGITHIRKTHSLCYKMLHLCELISGSPISNNRSVIFNGVCSVPIEKESDLLRFKMNMDIMIMSNNPLSQVCEKEMHSDKTLPNIHPSHPVIGVKPIKNYSTEDMYPIKNTYSKYHAHTIFAYYDIATMKNITERPVREDQICARSLAKCFTTAASYAREKFGSDIKDLPNPVTIQCIQCDGQQFHFSVFQLNTLNLNGTDGLRNYWWSMPRIYLYKISGYEEGKPVTIGYNPEVFQTMLAFYKNS